MAVASRKSRSAILQLSLSIVFFLGFASSTSSFSSRSTTLFHRSSSPTRVNLCGSSAPSVRFSLDRSVSPSRSIAVAPRPGTARQSNPHQQKRTCTCSPTTHPGSFRCGLHKKTSHAAARYSPNRLNARRSAMTNSLVRIRGVEGDLVKRALAALIRPSSHQQEKARRTFTRGLAGSPLCPRQRTFELKTRFG
ncbi:trinucleotide repeat-containing protein [Spatholobus suberectus]|nr:trinucleotide repeat-containing protein [Spatholobus suberectus]